MRILKKLEKSWEFWFLVLASFLFFLLRFPSLFEPLWYGDEGIYQAIGTSLNNGKQLYAEVFDNKPPLLYWLYAVLKSDQFSVRFTSLIFGLLSVTSFFYLSKKLFQNNIKYLTTSIFAVLFGLPLLEGNIANAENFMLLPIILAAYLIINHSSLIIPGFLLGIAFLFKIVAIFDFAAFFIFCFFTNLSSTKKEIKPINLFLGFIIPIISVTLYFFLKGTFGDFINAALVTNIPYVSYGNKIGNFPFLLLIKTVLLASFTLFVYKKRKQFSNTTIFVILWFAFSLFNALFSQRPYTHYLLVLLPGFSLMTGLILFDKKYQRKILITFIAAGIIIMSIFRITNFKKAILYYENFISYMKGGKTTSSYQAFFDRNTPIDYEVAFFIKPKLAKNDTIFVWGNNAQLYELVDVVAPSKYVVSYHMTGYKDGVTNAKNSIEKTKPKFIVVMPNVPTIPFPLMDYSLKININKVSIYEKIF